MGPAATADQRPKPIALLRSLAGHFRRYRLRLVVIFVLATLSAALEAAIVLLIAGLGSMLINGAQQVEKSMLGVNVVLSRGALCGIALAAVLARSVLDLVLMSVRASTDGRYDSDARTSLITGFLDSDWGLQSEERTGGLQAALGTYVGQARTALQRLADFLISLVSFLILFAVSVLAGGAAAVVAVAIMAVVAVGLRPLIDSNHRAATSYRDTVNGFSEKAEQIVRMAREIRIFAARPVIEVEAERQSRDVGRSIAQMEVASGRLSSLSTSITYLAAVGGLIALIALGTDSPQPYVAMVLLLYRALIYGRSLQSTYQGLVASAPFVEALDERRSRYERSVEPEGRLVFDSSVETIEFEDVSFAYPGGERVLDDVSFTIHRGEAIGIVGPSGSGKSTVIQLLLGFRQPVEGRVCVNGSPPSAYSRSSWAEHLTLVPQEALLFDTTVSENVICYRQGISDTDVKDAVTAAHLLEEIEGLPGAFESAVGEGGRRLSGGQRQRLCLARSLAGRPDVLVLDEPTSALDLISEEAIRQTLNELKGKVTMVIIAHRMSTLRLCDRVLVMNNGRLEASGRREDLEQGNKYYAQAIKLSKLA